MSFDLVVATRRDLDPTDLLIALDEVAPEADRLHMGPDRGGRVLAVLDAEGHEVLWVGPTREIRRPAEQARRLGLGLVTADDAFWTDLCVRDPDDLGLARSLARRLTAAAGGRVLDLAGGTTPEARGDGEAETGAPGRGGSRTPPPAPSPFDAVGDTECVLVHRRPVLGLGPWLAHALLTAADDGRRLVVVTPPDTRITPVVDRLVQHGALRWVVDDGEGAVEVHRRRAVRWDGSAMVDDPGAAERADGVQVRPGAAAAEGVVWALHCETEILLADDEPVVGRSVEVLLEALQLPPVEEVGLFEPGESPWLLETVTSVAHRRSPGPTRVAVAGPGVDGTLSVLPQPGGVLERVEVVADAGEAPRDAEQLAALGARLLEAGLQLAVIGYRRVRPHRVLDAAAGDPVLPALLVAHPARFPRAGSVPPDELVPGLPPGRPGVLAFPTPTEPDSEASRTTLEQWRAALHLLRSDDTLARAVDGAPSGRAGGAYSGA